MKYILESKILIYLLHFHYLKLPQYRQYAQVKQYICTTFVKLKMIKQ